MTNYEIVPVTERLLKWIWGFKEIEANEKINPAITQCSYTEMLASRVCSYMHTPTQIHANTTASEELHFIQPDFHHLNDLYDKMAVFFQLWFPASACKIALCVCVCVLVLLWRLDHNGSLCDMRGI